MSRDPDTTHWLLPINPAAHADHLPADWRTRPDAVAIWHGIARSQPVERWCLRTGFRTMRPGHHIWAYLSARQELCAVGLVRAVVENSGAWFVEIDWDAHRTSTLCAHPLPRSRFGQVPMSTCRADPHTTTVLARLLSTM